MLKSRQTFVHVLVLGQLYVTREISVMTLTSMMMMMMMQNAVLVIQVYRRQLSSDEPEAAGVEKTSEANSSTTITLAAAAARQPSDTRLSSPSTTSTASDDPPSNGPSNDNVFDGNNGAAGLPQVMSSENRRGPESELAPPVPPPRRYGGRHGGGFADVWQRHAAVPRPATDVVHRRVLAAAAGPSLSSTPKSCPTSPLLDGGAAARRTDARRTTHDHEAPAPGSVRGLASAPVTRRTRLPMSPLVRTGPHPDVRWPTVPHTFLQRVFLSTRRHTPHFQSPRPLHCHPRTVS